ncbi:MAG: helix-turn-helix domain-containing protein [Pseudomonadota bacterium]
MLSIGALSRQTGTKVPTIRYYEKIGLLPEPGRSTGGQRRYGSAEADRLAFIRHARQLGFPLDDIRELLDLSDHPDRPCEEVDAIARRQLDLIGQRLERLVALQGELQRMVTSCQGGATSDCRVLEVLRSHANCLCETPGDRAPDA